MPKVNYYFEDQISESRSSVLRAHANGRNKSQHCCVLLGFLANMKFDRFQTIRNKCQHCCIVVVPYKRTQHIGPTMLRVVGQQYVSSVCMGLYNITSELPQGRIIQTFRKS